MAEYLESIDFDAVYSSDLRRCLATVELILGQRNLRRGARHHPQVRTDKRLREINAGLWEMLSFEDALRMYPEAHAERERDLTGFRFPGGESFRDLQERVVQAFDDIVREGHARVLVVAHRGVNRTLLCHLLEIPLEDLFTVRQDYGAVSLIELSTGEEGGPATEIKSLFEGWAR